MKRYIALFVLGIVFFTIIVLYVALEQDLFDLPEFTATSEFNLPAPYEELDRKAQLDELGKINPTGLSEEEKARRISLLESLTKQKGSSTPVSSQQNTDGLKVSPSPTSTQSEVSSSQEDTYVPSPQSGAKTQDDVERLKTLESLAQ
jgi:hypothetical protein